MCNKHKCVYEARDSLVFLWVDTALSHTLVPLERILSGESFGASRTFVRPVSLVSLDVSLEIVGAGKRGAALVAHMWLWLWLLLGLFDGRHGHGHASIDLAEGRKFSGERGHGVLVSRSQTGNVWDGGGRMEVCGWIAPPLARAGLRVVTTDGDCRFRIARAHRGPALSHTRIT